MGRLTGQVVRLLTRQNKDPQADKRQIALAARLISLEFPGKRHLRPFFGTYSYVLCSLYVFPLIHFHIISSVSEKAGGGQSFATHNAVQVFVPKSVSEARMDMVVSLLETDVSCYVIYSPFRFSEY